MTNDFTQKAPLGQTGLMVSRLGIGSSYGASASVIEEAVEQGVNYLYWGTLRRSAFGRAMRNLARRNREEIVQAFDDYNAGKMGSISPELSPSMDSG